ncbi:MAG: hypothetical protein V8S95_02615, partial [Odoribacter sp.]
WSAFGFQFVLLYKVVMTSTDDWLETRREARKKNGKIRMNLYLGRGVGGALSSRWAPWEPAGHYID